MWAFYFLEYDTSIRGKTIVESTRDIENGEHNVYLVLNGNVNVIRMALNRLYFVQWTAYSS